MVMITVNMVKAMVLHAILTIRIVKKIMWIHMVSDIRRL